MLSRCWLGRSSRLLLLLLVLTVPLSSCSKVLPLLTGSGPNVAANVQVGKTNTQTVGKTSNHAPTVSVRPNARVEKIDQSVTETTNNQLPVWAWIGFIVLFIIGWVTDTPATYISRLRLVRAQRTQKKRLDKS